MDALNKKLPRRNFLKLSTGTTAAALLPLLTEAAPKRKWKNIPIATQLWCVRKELVNDIPGVLGSLAAIGYQGVELENTFGKSGKEWRRHLDNTRLKACGFHHSYSELQGDKLQTAIEFNQAIGNDRLIVRSLPKDVYTSKAELLKVASTLNEISEKLKPAGLRVGYHNHTSDFNKIEGEYWWNLFADQTRKNVILQFDTGNASEMEGVSVLDFLKRNKGRTISMHVKPFSKAKPDAFLGADELKWNEIMKVCETVGGIEWYIIEYERPEHPPLDALRANYQNFLKMRS
jgi:sugar phosphate isomerase/epimerase